MRSKIVTILILAFVGSVAFCAEPNEEQKPKKKRTKIKISKETTRIDGPLDEDGYVDYHAALNQMLSMGVTVKNNAAVPVVKALGPKNGELPDDEDYRADFFKRLGIDDLPEEGDYFVSLYDLAQRDAAKSDRPGDANVIVRGYYEEQSAAMERPWVKDDLPVAARWVSLNEKPLALVSDGVGRTHWYMPYADNGEPVLIIGILLPMVQNCRSLARVLNARAMLRLGEGDVEGAWKDLMTLHRLARHVAKGATLVERLVGIAIDGIACGGDRVVALSGQVMTAQALRFRGDLEKLPPMPRMAEAIDTGERYLYLDSAIQFSRNTPGILEALEIPDDGRGLTKFLTKFAVDWNEPMRVGNLWYDKFVAADEKPTYLERKAALVKVNEELDKMIESAKDPKAFGLRMLLGPRKAVGTAVGKMLVALFVPAVEATVEAEARSEMNVNLTQLTLALTAYKNDHGSFPDDLGKLAPKYIAEVPNDFYVGEALRYSKQDNGFSMYSFGRNGIDDSGAGPFSELTEGDDLAVTYIPE